MPLITIQNNVLRSSVKCFVPIALAWKFALSQLLLLPWPLPGKWLCRGCKGECGLQQRLQRARPELPSLLPMTLIAPNHFVTPKRLA